MRATAFGAWLAVVCGSGMHSASSLAGATAPGATVRCEGVYAEHGKGAWIDARVDDDYCDCEAGEDEPGTAACSHVSVVAAAAAVSDAPKAAASGGRLFFCANAGARPMHIFHSRVGDGICDCCDGSDEAGAGVSGTVAACGNTCASVGREWRLEQQRARDTLREGIAARREYISRGAELSRNTATRQDMLAEELATLKAKTAGLAEKKTAAEAEEQAQRKSAAEEDRGEVLRRSRILEVIGAAAESSEGVSQFAYDLLAFAKTHNAVGAFRDFLLERLPQDADERTTLPLPSMAELEAEAAYARNEEASIATATATAMEVDAVGGAALNANTIDHTDIPDDPAAAAALAAKIAAEAAAASDTTTNPPVGDAVAAAAAAAESIQAEAAGHAPSAAESSSPPSRQTLAELLGDGDAEGGAGSDLTLPEAEEARTAYNAHLSLVSDKEREIKDAGGDKEAAEYGVEKKFGRDGEFRVLKDKCFKKTVQGYAYEMCFFKNAKQDHVRLGSWDDVTWTANGFSEAASADNASAAAVKAKFSGGQRCWNGPARSLSVDFECHGEDAILDVTEPSVCEYRMRFGTPAVCQPSTLEALERELGEL